MRLSEEKVARLAEVAVDHLRAGREAEIRGDGRALVRDLARFLAADLRIEDEITQEALARLGTYSRGVAPGSTEWELLLAKHKEEIAARRGYVL